MMPNRHHTMASRNIVYFTSITLYIVFILIIFSFGTLRVGAYIFFNIFSK